MMREIENERERTVDPCEGDRQLQTSRRRYEAPQVVAFGSLQRLTFGSNPDGTADGGLFSYS